MEQKNQSSSDSQKNEMQRMITPHGEVDVEITPDKKNIYYPLKTEELKPLPEKFREIHVIEMKLFHSILMYIKKHQANRTMPVTRKEFLRSGADPRVLSQLIEFGMLKPCILPVRNSRGVNQGSRACLYYTDQGRALIRARLDPTYALTENT